MKINLREHAGNDFHHLRRRTEDFNQYDCKRRRIAVALALSLPANEYKPTILTITYAVVLFSIIVQGLTIKPLVERIVSKGELAEPSD